MLIPVEGNKNLFRNSETGAIINYDEVGYNAYIKSREEKKKQKNEIDQLKKDVDEIKQLLKDFINESKRN